MGTRSLTRVMQGKDVLVCMYRQYNGYPSGHGKDLRDFLLGVEMTNGFNTSQLDKANNKLGVVANGMECLAAQIVAHFKNQTPLGNIYLMPVGTMDAGAEYIYTVYLKKIVACGNDKIDRSSVDEEILSIKVQDVYAAHKKEKSIMYNGLVKNWAI